MRRTKIQAGLDTAWLKTWGRESSQEIFDGCVCMGNTLNWNTKKYEALHKQERGNQVKIIKKKVWQQVLRGCFIMVSRGNSRTCFTGNSKTQKKLDKSPRKWTAEAVQQSEVVNENVSIPELSIFWLVFHCDPFFPPLEELTSHHAVNPRDGARFQRLAWETDATATCQPVPISTDICGQVLPLERASNWGSILLPQKKCQTLTAQWKDLQPWRCVVISLVSFYNWRGKSSLTRHV